MSMTGDIQGALKAHGYKLEESNKHLLYRDAQGHEVRVHLGGRMKQSRFSSVMKDIARGSIKTGKKAGPVSTPIWDKISPVEYLYKSRGNAVGRCIQHDLGQKGNDPAIKGWWWFAHGWEDGHWAEISSHKSLAEAKEAVEEAIADQGDL